LPQVTALNPVDLFEERKCHRFVHRPRGTTLKNGRSLGDEAQFQLRAQRRRAKAHAEQSTRCLPTSGKTRSGLTIC
jgi:hypothetical protein